MALISVIVISVFAVIALSLVLWFISVYNGLIVSKNRIKNSFSQIDVLLKQRFDMVPNLVETVKGYAKHERETFNEVINARNNYNTASSIEGKAESDNMFSSALGKLFALTESYPDLKANQNFLELQEQLKDLEEQIRFSRQMYNDTVQIYNDKILVFPNNLISNMFGFKEESYFEISQEEKQNVKVTF